MKEERRVLTLDPYEQGIVITALNDKRNKLLEEQKCTGMVDDVLLKAIDAPRRRGLRSLVLPDDGQKLDRSVAPPLPTKSADFAGTPNNKVRVREWDDEAR